MDGKNHSITDCEINASTHEEVGFFRSISDLAEVRNIKIENSKITVSARGAFIGTFAARNFGTIEDCQSSCDIKMTVQKPNKYFSTIVGGIVGINNNIIKSCSNFGEVNVYIYNDTETCEYAGGIAGENYGHIMNCCNHADISSFIDYSKAWGPSYLPRVCTGGIVGTNVSGERGDFFYIGDLLNCFNMGNVSTSPTTSHTDFLRVGGIVASAAKEKIFNCYYSSSAEITGPHINTSGMLVSLSKIQNNEFDFTSLLNNNVANKPEESLTYWCHSFYVNNNIPFHLNGNIIKTQIENINQNTADFKVYPIDLSSSVIVNKGFEYKKEGELTYKRVYAPNDFSVTVADLELSEVYKLRAFVTTSNSVIYFNELEFTTSPIYVETKEATNVTAMSAVLKGHSQSGSTAIKSQGFLWKAENEKNYHVAYTEGQEFEYKLDGLSPYTIYNFQAFVLTTSGDNLYGEQMSFSTLPVAIIFNDNTIVDQNKIILNGNININVSTDVTVEYKKSDESNYSKKIVKSNTDGSFECDISELQPYTDYDCRAYIIFNGIYTYSQVYTLKTLNVRVQTLTPLLGNTVTFRGEVIGGSSTAVVGFEYRDANYPDLVASDIVYSNMIGTSFTAQTTNAVNGNEYKYRAFYEDKNGNKTYGEWIYFIPTDIISNINNIDINNNRIVMKYYDVKGIEQEHLTKGINVVKYSDGTTKKVIVK